MLTVYVLVNRKLPWWRITIWLRWLNPSVLQQGVARTEFPAYSTLSAHVGFSPLPYRLKLQG